MLTQLLDLLFAFSLSLLLLLLRLPGVRLCDVRTRHRGAEVLHRAERVRGGGRGDAFEGGLEGAGACPSLFFVFCRAVLREWRGGRNKHADHSSFRAQQLVLDELRKKQQETNAEAFAEELKDLRSRVQTLIMQRDMMGMIDGADGTASPPAQSNLPTQIEAAQAEGEKKVSLSTCVQRLGRAFRVG